MGEESTAPAPASTATPVVVWSMVFAASFVVMLLEVAWIAFLFWLPLYVNRSGTSKAGTFVACLCVVTIIAHAFGYKVMGSPPVVDTRPFEPDAYLIEVGPGLRMSLADGRTFHLAGLTELRAEDGQGRLGPALLVVKGARSDALNLERQIDAAEWKQAWSELDHQLHWWKTPEGVPVQVNDLGEGRASIRVGIRHNYWCGNTFFPQLFPGRLPRYGSQELAEALLWCSDAVKPDGSLADAAAQSRLDQIQKHRDTVVGDRQSGR